jgi:hypothetical protein
VPPRLPLFFVVGRKRFHETHRTDLRANRDAMKLGALGKLGNALLMLSASNWEPEGAAAHDADAQGAHGSSSRRWSLGSDRRHDTLFEERDVLVDLPPCKRWSRPHQHIEP